MGENFQSQLAALAPRDWRGNEGFETTFDHGNNRFDLNSITIGGSIEASLHQSPVMAAGGLGRGPAVLGGNDGADTMRLAGKSVICLRVVTGVSDDGSRRTNLKDFCARRISAVLEQITKMRSRISSRKRLRQRKIVDT